MDVLRVKVIGIIAFLAVVTSNDSMAISKNGFVLDDASIPVEEILNGGPGRDGIPAINQPRFITADAANFLDPGDRVLGVSLNGINRAYPIRILNYHEVVNDILGNTPVVITYCPLCGSGMAFSANISDTRLVFGVSGLLYNSDVLLYDTATESLWSQIKSVAVTGPMKGTKIDAIALAHTTWRDWRARHPHSQVLSSDTGFKRSYQIDPYPDYRRSGRLYFPVAAESRKYRWKSLVMGVEIDGHFKAYPFDELKQSPEQFTDEFQGRELSVWYDHKNRTARMVDSDGGPVPTAIMYWFAWFAFHPDTAIYSSR
jgi:hypothetical protein